MFLAPSRLFICFVCLGPSSCYSFWLLVGWAVGPVLRDPSFCGAGLFFTFVCRVLLSFDSFRCFFGFCRKQPCCLFLPGIHNLSIFGLMCSIVLFFASLRFLTTVFSFFVFDGVRNFFSPPPPDFSYLTNVSPISKRSTLRT